MSAASPRAFSAASSGGTATASVTNTTSAPSARRARPSDAAPGGPSVSGSPGPSAKPVVRRTRRPRWSVLAAAGRAPRDEEARDPAAAGIEREQVIDHRRTGGLPGDGPGGAGFGGRGRGGSRGRRRPRGGGACVRLLHGEEHAGGHHALLVERHHEPGFVEEEVAVVLDGRAVRLAPSRHHHVLGEDEAARVEAQHPHRVGAVARGQENAELDEHLVEARRRALTLVCPLVGVIAVDLLLVLFRGRPEAGADHRRGGDAGLDPVPLGGGPRPGEREQPGEQRQPERPAPRPRIVRSRAPRRRRARRRRPAACRPSR
jgi:hypothetical protein